MSLSFHSDIHDQFCYEITPIVIFILKSNNIVLFFTSKQKTSPRMSESILFPFSLGNRFGDYRCLSEVNLRPWPLTNLDAILGNITPKCMGLTCQAVIMANVCPVDLLGPF